MDWSTIIWLALGAALIFFMIRGCGGMARGCGMGGCGKRADPRHAGDAQDGGGGPTLRDASKR